MSAVEDPDALLAETGLPAAAVHGAPPARPARPHAPWREVLLLGALTAFGSVAMDMYLPALPTLTRALHATADQGRFTISVFLTGLALGQLVYGPLSDRWGRRPPLLGGILLYGLASAACFVAADIGLMTAARLLQALGACAGSVVARAVVRDRYADEEVIHVYALLSLVFGVAPIAAPMLGGWVLGAAGWRAIFGIQLAFAVGVGAWAVFALPESRSEATRAKAVGERPVAGYLALLREPRLLGYLLTGSLSGAALFAYISSAPEVVITQLGVAPAHFGWVFGANALGMIGAGQVNARLSRRTPSPVLLRRALYAALAASLLLVACAWTGAGGAWGVLAPLFLVIASVGFSQPNATAGAMLVDRTRAGATAALLGASFFGVGSLAGAASGQLRLGAPSRAMAVVIAAALVLAVAAFELAVRPAERRRGLAQAARDR